MNLARSSRGGFRVLVLGDSYVEGRQVELPETVSRQLEKLIVGRMLQGGDLRRFVAINGGVSAYSPALYHLCLKHGGLALLPDLVVLYFCFNDVQNDSIYGTMEKDGQGLPVKVTPLPTLQLAGSPLRCMELLQPAFSSVIDRPRRALGMSTTPNQIGGNALGVFRERYTPSDELAWKDTCRYLAGIWDLLRSHGVGFVLAMIPCPAQVGANQWRTGKVKWGLRVDEIIASTHVQDTLRVFAAREGIAYLDLLPSSLRNANRKLFYDYDGHWTAAGHELAARETVEFLLTRGLLSKDVDASRAGKGTPEPARQVLPH